MGVTTVRLKDEDLKELKVFAGELGFDQSTVLKQALKRGMREMRLEFALEKYRQHKLSLSEAAEHARVSMWEFLEELKKRGAFVETDSENLEETLKELE